MTKAAHRMYNPGRVSLPLKQSVVCAHLVLYVPARIPAKLLKVGVGAVFAREDGDSGGPVTQTSRVQGSVRRFGAGGDGAGFRDRPRLPVHPALARAIAASQ